MLVGRFLWPSQLPRSSSATNSSHCHTTEPSSSDVSVWLAVGILSPPENEARRAILRATWLSVVSEEAVTRFIVRARGAPPSVCRRLQGEAAAFGDTLLLRGVAYNETNLRGPVLTLIEWIDYAARRLPLARFVAKVDDDVYVHAPGVVAMLQRLSPSLRHKRVLAGPLAWHGWSARQWQACGFGWRYQGAARSLEDCRRSNSTSYAGPFPFAIGYIILLSAPLVAALSRSPALRGEAARLRAVPSESVRGACRHSSEGCGSPQIHEDVWLGFLVHTYLAASSAVAFVDLRALESVSDLDRNRYRGPLKIHMSAAVVHVSSKEVGVFLAAHDLLSKPNLSAAVCRKYKLTLSCSSACAQLPRFCRPASIIEGRSRGALVTSTCTSVLTPPRGQEQAWRTTCRPPINLAPAARTHAMYLRGMRVLESMSLGQINPSQRRMGTTRLASFTGSAASRGCVGNPQPKLCLYKARSRWCRQAVRRKLHMSTEDARVCARRTV